MWNYLTIDQALNNLQPYVFISYARLQYTNKEQIEMVIKQHVYNINIIISEDRNFINQSLNIVLDKVTDYMLGDRDNRGHQYKNKIIQGAGAVFAIIPELNGLPVVVDHMNEYIDSVLDRVSQSFRVSNHSKKLGFSGIIQVTKTQLVAEHIMVRIVKSKWIEELITMQEQILANKIITVIDGVVCDITEATKIIVAMLTSNRQIKPVEEVIGEEITRIIRDEPSCKMRLEFMRLYFYVRSLRHKLLPKEVAEDYDRLVDNCRKSKLSLMEVFSIINKRVCSSRKESYYDIESITDGSITNGEVDKVYSIKNILFDSKKSLQPGLCWIPAHGRLFREEYNSNVGFKVRSDNSMVIERCTLYHDQCQQNSYAHVACDNDGEGVYIKCKIVDTSLNICTAHFLEIVKGNYKHKLGMECIIYDELRLG